MDQRAYVSEVLSVLVRRWMKRVLGEKGIFKGGLVRGSLRDFEDLGDFLKIENFEDLQRH